MAQNAKSMIREYVERVDGVAATHFEMEINGSVRKKTLVVEVNFDLDPSSEDYSREKIGEIESAFSTIIREEGSDISSKFKIINRTRQSASKISDAVTPRNTSSTQNPSPNQRQSPN